MPQCAIATKPAASSYTIVISSAFFIPTALVSSLLLLVAVSRDPFKEIDTKLSTFAVASAITSLLTVPVNGLRGWFHSMNATGVNPYKAYPSVVPALHTCHVFWFATQFAGTCILFVIVLLEVCERQFSTRQKPNEIWVVIAIGVAGFGCGLASYWTGMALMTKIQTSLNNIIAASSVILAAFYLYPMQNSLTSGNERPGPVESTNSITKLELMKERQTENDCHSSIDMTIREGEKSNETTGQTGNYTYLSSVVFYFCCASSSGILLLTYLYADSLSCSAMFWVNDIQSLCMQFYLAVDNILLIITEPKFEKAVRYILKIKSTGVHPEQSNLKENTNIQHITSAI